MRSEPDLPADPDQLGRRHAFQGRIVCTARLQLGRAPDDQLELLRRQPSLGRSGAALRNVREIAHGILGPPDCALTQGVGRG
jgi:hypothetical protein